MWRILPSATQWSLVTAHPIGILFNAYPVEWTHLALAVASISICGWGVWDSILALSAVADEYPRRPDLQRLALGDIEAACYRFLLQIFLLVAAVSGVLREPPSPDGLSELSYGGVHEAAVTIAVNRSCMIAMSVISIVKEIRVMHIRHKVMKLTRVATIYVKEYIGDDRRRSHHETPSDSPS